MEKRVAWLYVVVAAWGLCSAACGAHGAAASSAETAQIVHLADEVGHAVVKSAPAPDSARARRSWRFDEPRPEWRLLSVADVPSLAAATLERLDDGVRLSLAMPEGSNLGLLGAGLVADLEDSSLADWVGVLVQARSHERVGGLTVVYNVQGERRVPQPWFFMDVEQSVPVFSDGSTQTYSLPLRTRARDATLENLAVFVGAPGPAALDVLSIELVPRGADFLEDWGVRSVTRDSDTRHTLFAHAPAVFTWRLAVPDGGRLDLGLACLPGEAVHYRATLGGRDGTRVLLEQTVDDAGPWKQVTLDLSPWARTEVELSLEAKSESAGATALFGAPILSGVPGAAVSGVRRRPNVVFYVIDGGGADLMSLYRYNRRTTPYLEELAAEGVVFERAYSNSTWTQASTASFMTSLHHSVLGGLRRGVHSTPVPAAAVTMAERMRRGGYQTAVFTSNANAGRVIGLERGVDVMRDEDIENYSSSSAELHERFWRFREEYPGTPYWVHFQTTDVHEPNEPEPPFAGLFVSAEQREQLDEWEGRLFEHGGVTYGTTSIADFYDRALKAAGIERSAYFNVRRGLYDETMAHQDEELRRFIGRLKAQGEWEDTLLVIGADHGHPAGSFARFGRGLFDPQPEAWQGALFDAYSSRVPLVFVWPAGIEGGRRFQEPVSMIDVLPTILELVGLPAPEVAQGRSLAPLLLGGRLPSRPVILDEFRVDEASGELVGNLELIDGRWGASLEIGPMPAGADPHMGRHAVPAGGRWGAVHPYFPEAPRLLLYDLWNDPFALHAVNAEHPDLVERYRAELLEHWEAQQALATNFHEGESAPLEPEQLEQLRALGYIR